MIINGNNSDNILNGTADDDTINGFAGSDTLFGAAGHDTLNGGIGDDVLRGGTGADVLNGGAGIDRITYFFSSGAVSVDLASLVASGGEAQGDVIGADIENVEGSNNFFDSLFGSSANNTLWGRGGNDALLGRAGDDTLDGGNGDDLLRGGAGADHLIGGAGVDFINYDDSSAGVMVNLTGLTASGGDAGGDMLSNDIENIFGTVAFDDILTGSAAANRLIGSGGNDNLGGVGGNDTLEGGAGDDFLHGGAGSDAMIGGTGIDTLIYGGLVGVTVNLTTLTASGGEAQGDVLAAGIENIRGTGANDTLTGSLFDNVLLGFGSDDTLRGLGGNDTLSGAMGNDFLQGGAGADHLGGGLGIDTIDYNGTAGVIVNLTTLVASGGEAQGDVLSNDIENIRGTGSFNDVLTGSAANNVLSGFGGDDILKGRAGADVLDGGSGIDLVSYFDGLVGVSVSLATGLGIGGEAAGDSLTGVENLSGSQGNDSLGGNAGANVLQGWNGNDTLVGGGGKDTLTGNSGADRYRFTAVSDSAVGANADRIADFSQAQGDRIDLSAIDANSGAGGNQAFSFIGTGLYTGVAGQLRFATGGGVTTVAGDIDGDKVSDFHIQLTGTIGLVGVDFVL